MKKVNLACIIDDDPIFVFATKRIMSIANFCDSFLIFNNGEEALESLYALMTTKEELPAIILLDVNMPVMDGWQFLDKLTEYKIPETITIYVVTSSINPDDLSRAKKYKQVSNYIVKPVTVDKLCEILKEFEPKN